MEKWENNRDLDSVFFQDIENDEKKNVIETVKNINTPEYFEENTKSTWFIEAFWEKIPKTPTIFEFDKDRMIHMVGERIVLVIYKDKDKLLADIQQQKKINVHYYDFQSPDVLWYIQDMDKYFLVLKARNPLDWISDNVKYCWLIINPNIPSESYEPTKKELYDWLTTSDDSTNK